MLFKTWQGQTGRDNGINTINSFIQLFLRNFQSLWFEKNSQNSEPKLNIPQRFRCIIKKTAELYALILKSAQIKSVLSREIVCKHRVVQKKTFGRKLLISQKLLNLWSSKFNPIIYLFFLMFHKMFKIILLAVYF